MEQCKIDLQCKNLCEQMHKHRNLRLKMTKKQNNKKYNLIQQSIKKFERRRNKVLMQNSRHGLIQSEKFVNSNSLEKPLKKVLSENNQIVDRAINRRNSKSLSLGGDFQSKGVKICGQQKQNIKNQICKNDIQKFEDTIFSKQETITKNFPIMPNPQCLGFVQFFYRYISYNFDESCEKFFLLSQTRSKNKNVLKNCLLSLIQCSKQGYIIISDKQIRNSSTCLKGIYFDNKTQKYLEYLVQALRELTYQVGQQLISMDNFDVSTLPILQPGYIGSLDQDDLVDKFIGYFAIRIKFSPYVPSVILAQNANQRHKIKRSKCSSRHWPVECEKPLSLSFVPKFQAGDPQISRQIQRHAQGSFMYPRITVLKLFSKTKEKLIEQLKSMLVLNKINFTLFQPFINQRTSNRFSTPIWVLTHQCPYQTIFQHVGLIDKLGDIKAAKALKNIMIDDENFFTPGDFRSFKKRFSALTKANYLVFNVKNKMRLYYNLKSPVYFMFSTTQLAILAFCLLLDCNIKTVKFVGSKQIVDDNNSQSGKYIKKVVLKSSSFSLP